MLDRIVLISGSTGPAIGGDPHDENVGKTADALIQKILSAEPIDFEYEGYYPDGPNRISMGIKNGKVYYYEVEIRSPQEVEVMYEELGWNL